MTGHLRRRLLLADDSADYRRSLLPLLRLDYDVDDASSVQAALQKLESGDYDLVVADLRLTNHEESSDVSGLMVAKAAKDKDIPTIIVTGFATVDAARLALRARGAEALAEDLVPKIEGPHPLLDAIQLVLSRRPTSDVLDLGGGLTFDRKKRLLYRDGHNIPLSPEQYALLNCLCSEPGKVFSLREIIQAVYGETMTEAEARKDDRVAKMVDRLQEKIEDDPRAPQRLIVHRGRGVQLAVGR